jgi:hypothetical protein
LDLDIWLTGERQKDREKERERERERGTEEPKGDIVARRTDIYSGRGVNEGTIGGEGMLAAKKLSGDLGP